ncbi:hypothetical protein K461DRAFT_298266 [Myriangium duriaei CBS 260.36]|uniref:Uncharacterized protein n=1 Tax=Myriangium duriaei CBS 260.36 TaxID=1168546 RepID=A0A9P4IPC6_9PEZI|nr:hypothetical protein K461DRAFT_298266 [Myriangium duriaei CBS 260.36]
MSLPPLTTCASNDPSFELQQFLFYTAMKIFMLIGLQFGILNPCIFSVRAVPFGPDHVNRGCFEDASSYHIQGGSARIIYPARSSEDPSMNPVASSKHFAAGGRTLGLIRHIVLILVVILAGREWKDSVQLQTWMVIRLIWNAVKSLVVVSSAFDDQAVRIFNIIVILCEISGPARWIMQKGPLIWIRGVRCIELAIFVVV